MAYIRYTGPPVLPRSSTRILETATLGAARQEYPSCRLRGSQWVHTRRGILMGWKSRCFSPPWHCLPLRGRQNQDSAMLSSPRTHSTQCRVNTVLEFGRRKVARNLPVFNILPPRAQLYFCTSCDRGGMDQCFLLHES